MKKLIIIIIAFLLVGCSSIEVLGADEVVDLVTLTPTPSQTATITPSPTITLTPTATFTPTSTPTLVPLTDFMEGVVFYGWERGDYLLPDTAWVMENQIKPTGANWIAIKANAFQENVTSTQIRLDYDWGMDDEDVIYLIQLAHKNGLRVLLVPTIYFRYDDAHWHGQIDFGYDEEKWAEWFDLYTEFILHCAQLAQENNVDLFSIGNELYAGHDSYIGPARRTQDWKKLIPKVREIYHGPLTYGANAFNKPGSSNYFGEQNVVQFWDQLDYIGIHAYYSLTQSLNPTVDDLVRAWRGPVAQLDRLSEKWSKPIIITEISYRSYEGATTNPTYENLDGSVDLQIQANAYEAAFQALQDQPWWRGVFWWGYKPVFGLGGPTDPGTYPSGKPAEDVLRHYYGGTQRSITPTPFTEPIQVLFDEAHNEFNTLSREYAENLFPPYPETAYFGELVESLKDVYLFTSNFDARLTPELLQDYDVLFLSAPRDLFSESEVDAIHEYVEKGGGLIVLGACSIDDSLNPITSPYGIFFDKKCLFKDGDPEEFFNSALEYSPSVFWISNFEDHPVTKYPRLLMIWGQSLKVTSPAVPLAYTDESIWADSNWNRKLDEDDARGPFTVLAASEAGTGRIVAFGCKNYGDMAFHARYTHVMIRSALEWILHMEY